MPITASQNDRLASRPLYCSAPNEPRSYEPIADLLRYGTGGELAVDCFLVISGFLVTRSACERDRDNYVFSRVACILPGLALVTLVEVFVIGPIFSQAAIAEPRRQDLGPPSDKLAGAQANLVATSDNLRPPSTSHLTAWAPPGP